MKAEIQARGYCIRPAALEVEWLDDMALDFESLTSDGYSARGVLRKSSVGREVASLLGATACELLGAEAQPPRRPTSTRLPNPTG